MKTVFWISLGVVIYTFVGYGLLLYLLVRMKRLFRPAQSRLWKIEELPSLTLIVAAYNEADVMEEKIQNTLALHYPSGRLQFIFVTSGSTDTTPDIVARHPQIALIHENARLGKIHAVHTAMQQVTTELIVFTDANTFLNQDALVNIARHYADPRVGAVSGEKRVQVDAVSDATAGEGFYWKYESALKRWDSELYSVVGAAGELFSIRSTLYAPLPPDTVLDDFMISMNIAARGYRIIYEPAAFAVEGSSENVGEELKRKVRIAAGGIQSILRLPALLNPFNQPLLTFQYISHRVLRWTVTPFLMLLAFVLNGVICFRGGGTLYSVLFSAQILFYSMALLGYFMERRQMKVKAFFVPYYFCLMNYAVLAGIARFAGGGQSAVWEKARRKAQNG